MPELLETEAVVIGAGFVELVGVPRLSLLGVYKVIFEAKAFIRHHTSGRDSAVIHARIGNGCESHKVRTCVKNKRQLFQYLLDRHVPHQKIGNLESAGGVLALKRTVRSIKRKACGFWLDVPLKQDFQSSANYWVNYTGLNDPLLNPPLRSQGQEVEKKSAKGHYFFCQGKAVFEYLIFPVLKIGGLGVQLTICRARQVCLDPDLEWVDCCEYMVPINKAGGFAAAISSYWPSCYVERFVPTCTSVGPKIFREDQLLDDFLIPDGASYGASDLVELYEIESPGATTAMVIADRGRFQFNLH